MKKQNNIDKVRASRDGHEYHEAWTARKALQLLLPTDRLNGISVEGLQTEEQSSTAPETNEIADIVLYYGKNCTFEDSERIKIVQFKYSIKSVGNDIRASNAKKTIIKFAIAFNDYLKQHKAKAVKEKLEFELITNRPIYEPFSQAVENIAKGWTSSRNAKINEQMKQFIISCGLKGKKLFEFAARCSFIGLSGNLTETKKDISRTLVDWSAGNDALAKACLGSLKQMVRDKAGLAGIKNNVIRQVDILATLELQDVNDLLPCPASLPEVGKIVQRDQLADAVKLIKHIDKPLLIHAAGGMGKTVFLESLSKTLSKEYEVLFFDCFGGGAYRAPEDSRHHPNQGLVHIINTLATNGLCDPILPGNHNVETLMKKFRSRLAQCVNTISTASKCREIIIFIDAIDNAYWQASDRKEPSFPLLVLKSLYYNGHIPGVKFIFSCRTHRIKKSTNEIPCDKLKLKPFNLFETNKYLRDRILHVTEVEVQVAQARSEGNPRIIEHLVSSDRGLLEKSEINKVIVLNDLIKARIEDALRAAKNRGYTKEELDSFLAGLTILPPPVPIDEYASINKMDVSAVESFSADLAPLLERTKYGLIFRDEPTETLIRDNQGSNKKILKTVAKNLLKQQGNSVYAAKALPDLLRTIGDGVQLFKLAFDERFPSAITSTVGKRNIRYSRLKAATLFAANKKDYNRLIHLLLELSTITSVDQRGTNYILDAPDIVVAANDIDAMRRVFETRTSWPGTRHARLTIINTLLDDFEAANRHAVNTEEWVKHYLQKRQEPIYQEPQPDHLDVTAIPFSLISQNRVKNALSYMRIWKDWYSYEISEFLFSLLSQLELKKSGTQKFVNNFLECADKEMGLITGALSFLELDNNQIIQLINKLSRVCKVKKFEFHEDIPGEYRKDLRDGLLKSTALAVTLGLKNEANIICRRIPQQRPNIWSFRESFSIKYILPFLERVALLSANNKDIIVERDILPSELYNISRGIKKTIVGADFNKKLKKRLDNKVKQDVGKDNKYGMSYNQKQEADRFIDEQIEPMLILVRALSNVLRSTSKKVDRAFLDLLNAWEITRNTNDLFRSQEFKSIFLTLGCELLLFALWSRADLNIKSVKVFLKDIQEHNILNIQIIIRLVTICAKRKTLHELAGEQAIIARSFIEKEDDVAQRARYYIKLARAILPASQTEASTYFKIGLEQMDAIGSGDFEFTNELLLFASSLRGDEIEEPEVHTLTNICELNMYEGEKFPWASFSQGLAKVSGFKALAKISRWDDRSKITLDYTLLPYLTALIHLNKIEPEYVLALNLLANPVELYSCNTATLAKEILNKNYKNQEVILNELIRQHEVNNPGVKSPETLKTLAEISQRVLGKTSRLTLDLIASEAHYSRVRRVLNDHGNYHGQYSKSIISKRSNSERKQRIRIKKIANSTNPVNEIAMAQAVEELNRIQEVYSPKNEFFEKVFQKVSYSDRAKYISIIAKLENLNLYIKLRELEKCKARWTKSSSSLSSTFKDICKSIVQIHAEDFISYNQVWDSKLKEVSDITGVSISILALELIKSFVLPDSNVSASIWLGIASIISSESDEGEGQKALSRLLKSNSTKLASSVVDGEWKDGLYPSNNQIEIATGLVWRMLGSYRAEDRWRAAHSIRCFIKLGKWEVIDALVNKYLTENSHPFQAPELPFYYLHARLWLLIALARISKDHPEKISQYYKPLLDIILDRNSHHILLKHFASKTLLNCIVNGNLKLTQNLFKEINQVNKSLFPRLKKKLKRGMFDSFYHRRPDNAPEEKFKFHFDYDFEKYDIKSLSDVFGKPGWAVKDIISEIAYSLDPKITSMYEKGGRDIDRWDRYTLMNSKYNGYGHYIGYHALLIGAGKLLQQHPITDDWYYDEPWEEWIGRRLLTREDGLWLSDGIDKIPLEFNTNILEKGKENLVITGSKDIILSLIKSKIGTETWFNINGLWNSPDKIKVDIDSVLVKEKSTTDLIKKLLGENPMSVWLPSYDTYEEEQISEQNNYIPWLIQPSCEAKLDENDPLGDINAQRRPQFSEEIINTFSIKSHDPFKGIWKNSTKEIVATSLAWGGTTRYEEDLLSGYCLLCSSKLLKEILTGLNANLVILIKLERYDKGYGTSSSSFFHTIAVIRINKNLELRYYRGANNKLHKNIY
jgi:hypothetical protein